MVGAFGGLNAARRGLQAEQTALDLVSQNVANANVKGYTRRGAALSAAPPLNLNSDLQVGTGADLEAIVRYRNVFSDRQYRAAADLQGYQERRSQGLEQLDRIFGEPAAGLRGDLDAFWSALQTLSARPGDLEMRTLARDRAVALVERAQSLALQMTAMQQELDATVGMRVDEVNNLLTQVADLNVQVAQVAARGQTPADLQDRRDLLLDRLSVLTGGTTAELSDGQMAFFAGGTPLVYGTTANLLPKPLGAGGLLDVQDPLQGQTMAFPGGELKAVLELRDADVPQAIADLDTIVKSLATQFNTAHQTGYGLDGSTGNDFFTIGAGALQIDINPAIDTNLATFAAAANAPVPPGGVAPDDGGNARLLAGIRDQAIVPMGPGGTPITVDEAYRSMIGALGVKGQQARQQAEIASLRATQAENHRQSESGVSLDEEMTRMIEHQKAYAASARVITAIDEALETIISRMGTVGR